MSWAWTRESLGAAEGGSDGLLAAASTREGDVAPAHDPSAPSRVGPEPGTVSKGSVVSLIILQRVQWDGLSAADRDRWTHARAPWTVL